jgi:5-deoxy-glucuronate isomerase
MKTNLLSKYQSPASDGQTQLITPNKANWKYVYFETKEIKKNQTISIKSDGNEVCLVVLSGKCNISTSELNLTEIGDRMSPFDRVKPWAVYINQNDFIELKALSSLEIAICRAPGGGDYPARIISPDEIGSEKRGKGNNQRLIHNILPETEAANSLLVVEVFTDEGNTSSYPSHKHDVDNYPHETYLEETYYHRFSPNQGFAFQRVYTEDGSIDESMAVYDKDVVMVPKGYHPVATVAGYNNYYLNVMAGPVRKWCFTWEDDHNWINGESYN